jgi:hypothetical protein
MFKHCIFAPVRNQFLPTAVLYPYMSNTKRKKRRAIVLVSIVILLAAAIGIYWYIADDKFADTKDRKAHFTVSALDFIHEFEKDNEAANQKYDGKIITVNGIVSETEAADTTVNLKMTDTASGSYVIFAFQDQHLAEAKSVKAGDSVSVKGSFSAGVFSRLLKKTSITFKRCTLNK